MSRVVVITGASAGIGLASAKEFLKHGDTVYNFSRRESPEVRTIKTDVSDPEAVKAAFKAVYEAEGRIDVLVNNAGMGISGAVENTADASVRKQMDVNFFGALYAMREIAPYMRAGGGGIIINMSSAAAALPIPFQAFYSASKAALSSLSNAFRIEVAPFNIKVCAVLPGDVRTEFTDKREKNKSNDPVYGDRIDKSVAVMERDERNGMPPEIIARLIYKLSCKKNPPPSKVGGLKYAVFVKLSKVLPERLVVFLISRIYG
jgi:NAD(P)-dependent dehydrogenase (short-subunit alcohol dehydrogenase family)